MYIGNEVQNEYEKVIAIIEDEMSFWDTDGKEYKILREVKQRIEAEHESSTLLNLETLT